MRAEDDARIRTRGHVPTPGCALDPCDEEISWVAWRLAAASPGQITSVPAVEAASAVFDRILEMSWLPGRVTAISEVATNYDGGGYPRVEVHLALGVLGPVGATAEEADALADLVHRRLHSAGLPYRAGRIDPAEVLDLPVDQVRHSALIRQRMVSVADADGDADIAVLSRWNPVTSPWASITTALLTRRSPTRVRATVLPTELNVTDRIEIDDALLRAEALRAASEMRPGRRAPAERAVATLVDLQASFSTPVLCVEIAVLSDSPLPQLFLRDVGSSLTSETDVLRRSGHTVVAGQQLMLGGFEIERDPDGLAEAVRTGLPLRGGVRGRELADIISLSESPIGWPIPVGGPIPTVPSGTVRELTVPAALSAGIAVGSGSGHRRVCLPHTALERHMFVTGATGTGKSTVLCATALEDLNAGRPFLFLDLHGDAADRIVAFADQLGSPVLSIDAHDAASSVLRLLPRLGEGERSREEAEQAATRVCDAIVASLPDKSWAGPRWYQLAKPILLLAMAHGVTIGQAIDWVSDKARLQQVLRHDALSPADVSTLNSLHSSQLQDAVGIRDWVTSKFGPLTGATATRIVTRAGHGESVSNVLRSGVPVVVNLSALASSEAALVGHLVLSSVLDAAMQVPIGGRKPIRLIVDEAQRFVVSGLHRVQTEGRKFGVTLVLATQSMGQLEPVLADIASSAAVQVAFRQSPDSATVLSPLLDIPARELTDLPDLNAYVKVVGESTCWVQANPYPDCPPLRVKRRLPSSGDLYPVDTLPVSALDDDDTCVEPGSSAPPQQSFLDDWLLRHAACPDTD